MAAPLSLGGACNEDPGASPAAAIDATVDATVDTAAAPIVVSAADFDCLTGWDKVRRFRIKSVNGRLQEALAVAGSANGGTYPAGTIIQLIPTEAMVKHQPGWSASTRDWEFFFLHIEDNKSVIAARGTDEVVNGFGGNCLSCHNLAKPQWDLVCEQDHGCAKLPFSAELIATMQDTDPRCTK